MVSKRREDVSKRLAHSAGAVKVFHIVGFKDTFHRAVVVQYETPADPGQFVLIGPVTVTQCETGIIVHADLASVRDRQSRDRSTALQGDRTAGIDAERAIGLYLAGASYIKFSVLIPVRDDNSIVGIKGSGNIHRSFGPDRFVIRT